MDTLKRNEKIIRESTFDKKIKKPGLKFNPGLALTGVRTTGPWRRGERRRLIQGLEGIFRIRDLTEIRCGIRENAECLDRQHDLTATREARFIKIWARDAGFRFACLSGIRKQTGKGSVWCPGGRRGGEVLPYMGYIGMCRYEGYGVWFSSSLPWDRVYTSESLGLEEGIIFHLN